MQGQIPDQSRYRLVRVVVQHQPRRNRGGYHSQEDGQIRDPDIHWLGAHGHRRRPTDDTSRGQQYGQLYRLSASHRWWRRHHLRRLYVSYSCVHHGHADRFRDGASRIFAKLRLCESISHACHPSQLTDT